MEREALVMSPSLFAHTSERQVYNSKSKCDNIIAIKTWKRNTPVKIISCLDFWIMGIFGYFCLC